MKLIVKLSKSSLVIALLIFSFSAFNAGVSMLLPAHVLASTPAANEACQGVGLASGSGCSNSNQIGTTLSVFINIFTIVIGLVAVIMIMVAGLQFITSNGNPQTVAKARSSLLYAIVGLVVVVLAQLIVHFVINQAAGSS